MVDNRQLNKFAYWIIFNGEVKPSEDISDGRWSAIVRYINREVFRANSLASGFGGGVDDCPNGVV
jgi:hypothetical protein